MPSEVHETTAAAPRGALLALAVGVILGSLAPNCGPMLLGSAIDGLSLDSRQGGLYLTLELLCFAVASVSVAARIDFLPRRRLALGAAFGVCVGHAAAAAAPSFAFLCAARVFAGACAGALAATANATIAGTRDPDRNFALCVTALVAATVVTLVLMPTFSVPYAHRGAYGVLAGVSLLLLPALWLFPTDPAAAPPLAKPTGSIGGLGALLLGSGLLVAASDGVIFSFAERIGLSIGLDAQQLGVGLGLAYLPALAGSLLAARLDTRFGRARPMLVAIATTALGGFTVAQTSSPQVFFAAIAIKNFSLFFWVPYFLGTTAAVDSRGRLAAAAAGIYLLGIGIGPSIAGWVVMHWSYGMLGWVGLSLASIAIALVLPVLHALATGREEDSRATAIRHGEG